MIVKQVPIQSVKKSDFAGLVKYITDPQSKNERVGFIAVTNCHSDRAEVAITEVLNTQVQNTRAVSDKTYHLIVSFRAGEQIDDSILKAIEARICDALGFAEHQRVSAVHHDTDNLHIHIAINKIHPTRYTINDPFNAYHTLGQLCSKLEHEYGLEKDNHQAQKLGSENRADDMEHHAGVESMLGWIKRECYGQMQGAQSWPALHQIMHANGLELSPRGNGFVITDGAGAGLGVKASSVARDLSKAKLEQRLGPFEPPAMRTASVAAVLAQRTQATPVAKVGCKPPPRSQNRLHHLAQLEILQINSGRRYEQQPMRSRVNTVDLHARYKAEQYVGNAERTVDWAKAIDRKNRLVEAAKRSGRLKRAAIKLIKGMGPGKRILYAATSKTLKDEIQKINKQYLEERQAIYDKYQRRAWADWLRAKATEGDTEALGALRAREAAQGLKGNTVAGISGLRPVSLHANQDSVTKKGTIIYRVGSTAVRDDGNKLNVARGASEEGLKVALRLALQRYGERIAVNGTNDFKEQIAQAAATAKLNITFDDAALEQRRQELLKTIPTKEKTHEHARARTHRGRTDRGRNGGAGHAATGFNATRVRASQFRTNGRTPVPGGGLPGKPNIGGIGQKPPPHSQNRLRKLSELGVVQLASGSEVLLPRDVSGVVEHERTQPDHGVRRNIFGSGGIAAAEKYIAEREATRLKAVDIPKHIRYKGAIDTSAAFAGIRKVDGQSLALLKRGEEIMVLPIDEATARRLKRVSVGDVVSVTTTGSIKTKGRSV